MNREINDKMQRKDDEKEETLIKNRFFYYKIVSLNVEDISLCACVIES